ncbi:hypothetical protein CEV33_3876 [Brucella grignonensis]|uniref:Uncharacterized protein n=1 Tax=Brucella grignonensis TaxID=94627 RepID=A0A256FRD9_9HYPH|nr:hypothetical protein CEV33_3876 [Brucella grignonensis]
MDAKSLSGLLNREEGFKAKMLLRRIRFLDNVVRHADVSP